MPQAAAETPFSKLFHDHLDEIERRALKVKSNLTEVCRDIHISRSTPDRWRRETPRTIKIIDKIDARVTALEKQAARAKK